jgi:hypothetical protein
MDGTREHRPGEVGGARRHNMKRVTEYTVPPGADGGGSSP